MNDNKFSCEKPLVSQSDTKYASYPESIANPVAVAVTIPAAKVSE